MPKPISINKGRLRLFHMLSNSERQSSEDIKDMIFTHAIRNDDGVNPDFIRGLLMAYTALVEDEEDEEDEWLDWREAEQVYIRFSVEAYRDRMKRSEYKHVAECSDEEIYERCDWWEFGEHSWPAKLIAELGYVKGIYTAAYGIQMAKHFAQRNG